MIYQYLEQNQVPLVVSLSQQRSQLYQFKPFLYDLFALDHDEKITPSANKSISLLS